MTTEPNQSSSETSSNPSTAAVDAPLAATEATAPTPTGAAIEAAGQTARSDAGGQALQEANSARPKIKIGTQREGVAAPKLPPRTQTVFQTQVPEEPKPAQSKPAQTQPAEGQPAQSKSPQAEVAATTTGIEQQERPKLEPQEKPVRDEPASAYEGEVPSELRPKPAPLAPSGIEKRPKFERETAKIPRPNLRAELSPDLEAELAESLGDLSLEEVLAADDRSKQASLSLEPETKVKARVMRVHRDDVFVEMPGMNQGVIALKNFAEPPNVGAMLDVIVARFNAEEGLYELAPLGGAIDVGDWSDITEGITVEARITGHNKGGLECEVNRIRGFIPVSQVSTYRVEDLEEFVGQKFPCVVTEANPDRRNLVLSRRAVLEREQADAKERLKAELAEGQEREGVVRNIRDFGAFVDLGGVDGMLHVSQLSWDRVKHPSDVLQLGQKIKVKIQKIDAATGKISLSYRDTFDNPWTTVATRYPTTARVKGTVSKIMDFGAFVRIEPGVEGLVHISELSHKRVFRVSDVVREGQEVEAKVLSVDPEAQRMSLSMKALEARAEPQAQASEAENEEEAASPKSPPRRALPLKGGLGRSDAGDQFGLRW
jgi:small subunit ribosomal protein S1